MNYKNKEKFTSNSILNLSFSDSQQESMLVTAMVHMPEVIGEVIKVVPNSHIIQTESIRSIFESICELYNDNAEIKKMSVIHKMRINGNFNALKISGVTFNFDHMTPSTQEQILMTCESLVSMYRRQISYDLIQKLNTNLTGDISDKDLSDDVFKVYEALTIQGGKNLEKTSKDAANGALREIEEAMLLKRSGKLSGIPTGSNKIDRILGGWQKDELILVCARPGAGKTACALDFCLQAAEQGFAVGFFSIEMDSEKLNYRLAASKTGIMYSEMIKGNITDEEFTRIQTALTEIGKLPIYYYDDPSISQVDKLSSVATEWCRKRDVKLIFIDYIQYLQALKQGNTTEQISAVSKAIKTLQRRLKIPVIALAQLSRAVESRADRRPIMEDLRESGQLEQDASIVIALFNPEYYQRKNITLDDEMNNNEPFPERMYCYYLLKSRNGGHYRIDRYADIPTNRFSDTDSFSTQNLMPKLNNSSLDNASSFF